MKDQIIYDGNYPNGYYRIYTHAGRLLAKFTTRRVGDYSDDRYIYDGDAEGYIEANQGHAGYYNMCDDLRCATDPDRPDSGWRRTRKGTLVQWPAATEVSK